MHVYTHISALIQHFFKNKFKKLETSIKIKYHHSKKQVSFPYTETDI